MNGMNMTERLAGSSARHPWVTLLVWVAILGGSFFATVNYLSLTDNGDLTAETESGTGWDLLEERGQAEEVT